MQTNPCNPFEIFLGKLVNLQPSDDFVDKAALEKIKAVGSRCKHIGYVTEGTPILSCEHALGVRDADGQIVGIVSECTHSDRFGCNIGVGMVSMQIDCATQGLYLLLVSQPRSVEVGSTSFSRERMQRLHMRVFPGQKDENGQQQSAILFR